MSDAPSITCPYCGAVSYHHRDIEHGYCGHCHWWTSDSELGPHFPEVLAERAQWASLKAMTTEPTDPDPVPEDVPASDPPYDDEPPVDQPPPSGEGEPDAVPVEGDPQHEPTPEEVAQWEAAVEIVRAEHPDWSDATIAGAIAYAVMTPDVQEAIAEIAANHALDVALWTSVIADLMERFGPGTALNWSEQDCNDNLVNLLRWSEAQALPESVTQRIADRPRFGPR